MARVLGARGALVMAVLGLTWAAVSRAQPPWSGESFLPDYSLLKPVTTRFGQDYVYLAPGAAEHVVKFVKVMIDQPEVFVSATSPYGGAKPADLTGVAEFVRSRVAAQLAARGYQVVTEKGADVVYLRIGVTDLKLKSKGRRLLAYTPVGFVLSTVVRAAQDFLQKMDVTNVVLQGEWLDSVSGEQLAEGVATRGEAGAAAGAKPQPLSYKQFESTIDDLSARFACRMDNGRVPLSERIDCSDPAARQARAPVAPG